MSPQRFSCFLQFHVEATERRAAVAGNESRGVEPAASIELALRKGQAHQRLPSGDQRAAILQPVLVIERNELGCWDGHCVTPARSARAP